MLRVNGLGHEIKMKIVGVVQKSKGEMKKTIKERELIREINIRLKKGRIIKMMKILRVVLKENGKMLMMAIKVLDKGPKISTRKIGLVTPVLLWISF